MKGSFLPKENAKKMWRSPQATGVTHCHANPHAASGSLSKLPGRCSRQFMVPAASASGIQILAVISGLSGASRFQGGPLPCELFSDRSKESCSFSDFPHLFLLLGWERWRLSSLHVGAETEVQPQPNLNTTAWEMPVIWKTGQVAPVLPSCLCVFVSGWQERKLPWGYRWERRGAHRGQKASCFKI